jgi:hypothetical protein
VTGIYIYLDEGDEVRVDRARHPDDVTAHATARIGDVTLYLYSTTATALHAALGEALSPPTDETE